MEKQLRLVNNMKKVFKKDGPLQLTFAADSTEQIQEWLGDVDIKEALQFATESHDNPVFGHTMTFPCDIIEESGTTAIIKAKEYIFENGTNEYCSPLHAARMFAEGNCPFSSVEAAMNSAMDFYANSKIDTAIWLIRQGTSKGIDHLCKQIEKLKEN